MARTAREQRRKDLKASFDAIKSSYFWTEYTKYLQRQHDVALTIVRMKASGPEVELRSAATLCSAFHTALSLPEMLMSGQVELSEPVQEDTEGKNDDDSRDE